MLDVALTAVDSPRGQVFAATINGEWLKSLLFTMPNVEMPATAALQCIAPTDWQYEPFAGNCPR